MKLTTEDTENTEQATPETDNERTLKLALEVFTQLANHLKQERDEARDQVEELTAVIKGLRAIMRQEAAK
jgi:hypothetical protein